MFFPQGCRIHFTLLGPHGQPIRDDVLEARSWHIDDNVVRMFNEKNEQIRTVNFSHVLVIQPLETTGPGAQNAHN